MNEPIRVIVQVTLDVAPAWGNGDPWAVMAREAMRVAVGEAAAVFGEVIDIAIAKESDMEEEGEDDGTTAS